MLKRRYFPVNFFFYDRCGIQSRLETLAQKGWLLESADYFGWRFVRSEPKTVRYALTYFVKQNQYTSEFDADICSFNELCEDRGWNYVTSRANMRVYCNESKNPLPMDTDPLVELDTIHRTAKRSFLRSNWIYIIISLLTLAMMAWLLILDPIKALADNRTLLSCVIFAAALVMSGVELVSYYRWRKKALQHAEATGEFLPGNSHPIFVRVTVTLIILIYIAHLLLEGMSRNNVETLLRFAIILIAGIIAYFVREHYKEKGASEDENRGSTIAIVLIAVILMSVGSSVITNQNSFEDYFPAPVPGSYEVGYNFSDPMPLYPEDLNLGNRSDGGYFETRSSILLSYTEYYPTTLWGGGQGLYYIILDVRSDFLYDFLYAEFFGESTAREELSPEIWGVDKVWQVQQSYGNTSAYHLCSDNRMIVLIFEPAVELTDEQKSLIGEKLSPTD